MAGFWQGKLKRKDLEEVSDDFAEFSLSSPARKIRRLDAELPPIMEEGEPACTLAFNQKLRQGNTSASVSDMPNLGTVVREEVMPSYPSNNEERAIVLYRPVETPLILSLGATNVSLTVSSDFIHGLKTHIFKPGNRSFDDKDKQRGPSDSSLAVVPWVPPQATMATTGFGGSGSWSKLSQEPMEAEEAEAASMEIEEDKPATCYGVGGEGVQQQQHQHCMTSQLLPNTSSPIMSSW